MIDDSIPRPPVYVHLAGSRRAADAGAAAVVVATASAVVDAAAALRGSRRVVFDDDHLERPIVRSLLGLRWRSVVFDDDHLGRPIVSSLLGLRRHIVSFWSDIATAAASPLLRGRWWGGDVRRPSRWALSLIGGALSLTDRMSCRRMRGLSRNRRASLPCAVLLLPI